MTGDFIKTTNDVRFVYHSLKLSNSSRGERGVAIFLSPVEITAYENANEEPPITSGECIDNMPSGRFNSLKLRSEGHVKNKKGVFRKKEKNKTSLPIAFLSMHYPCKGLGHDDAVDHVSEQLSNVNKNHHELIGKDNND